MYTSANIKKCQALKRVILFLMVGVPRRPWPATRRSRAEGGACWRGQHAPEAPHQNFITRGTGN